MDTQSKSSFLTADDIANWLVMNFENVDRQSCLLFVDLWSTIQLLKIHAAYYAATTKLPNSTHFVTDHALYYFGYSKMDLNLCRE